MKTIMAAKSPQDSSFSFSRRYLHWKKKPFEENEDENDEEIILNTSSFSHFQECQQQPTLEMPLALPAIRKSTKKSKLKSAIAQAFTKRTTSSSSSLGTRVVGTLFGQRRGHVRLAFQDGPKLGPAVLIELPTPTSVLVREMALGLVRVALECDKRKSGGSNARALLEEPVWRSYCNGRKCGYANKRDCGPDDWNVLRAVEPVSMGAGVLPLSGARPEDGELMYMRARYERVVGSKDSEAFYMINPDGTGGPELSIYFIRV
ncbi:hypothetical protein Fmac_001484 [Flemingia macrophylla]|uniref:Protein MIZU-KUSSEI 1 n=1 Tax=Flemingia macrophylla TaxID=520843 RepID=A0ABD1NH91_9FABA